MKVIKNKYDSDIIIVGGGIIGSCLACLLGQAGFEVILLDARAKPENLLRENDARVFAITIASENILKKAGAWSFLNEENISSFRRMHVWDENGNGEIRFESASVCQPTMGYIISHQVILNALHKKLNDMENITFLTGISP